MTSYNVNCRLSIAEVRDHPWIKQIKLDSEYIKKYFNV